MDEYKLVEVPTGSQVAIQTPEGEVLTLEEAIAELLNNVNKIKNQ